MAEDPAVEGRDRDVDAGRAEVGDEHVPGVRAERQLAGRPAAGARPDVALGHEPALDQLADPLGDDRPAQTGAGDELGARPRPPEPDLVEDDDERVERLVRAGARCWRVDRGRRRSTLVHARCYAVPVERPFALDMTKVRCVAEEASDRAPSERRATSGGAPPGESALDRLDNHRRPAAGEVALS